LGGEAHATPLIDNLRRRRKGRIGKSWYVDETYVKVNGRWCYLYRAIDRFGHEGPAELGKVETLLSALDRALAENVGASRPRLKQKQGLKQTLAGALVSLIDGRISVAPAPPRRRRPD